jgi:polyisoprenoid-binding protein YceI
MSDDHDNDHGHHHDHEHDHDHALIVDRLPEGTWTVDPEGSELLFKARAFRVLPVTGIFEDFHGSLIVDATGSASGTLVVQTASVNSGWTRRDTLLRGPDYFGVDRYPQMVFTLEKLEPSGSEHQNLNGSLRIHEKPVALSFPVYLIAHGDHLHLEGEVEVDHDPAGLGWSKPFYVGDRLRLETALTLTRA